MVAHLLSASFTVRVAGVTVVVLCAHYRVCFLGVKGQRWEAGRWGRDAAMWQGCRVDIINVSIVWCLPVVQ